MKRREFIPVLDATKRSIRGRLKRLNLPISIRLVRSIRKASRIALWLGTGCLLISLLSPEGGPMTALVVTVVLAILIDVSALGVGQRLTNREFAAALDADPGTDRRIILYLRSFNIAGFSLVAKFVRQLVYIVILILGATEGFPGTDFSSHRPYGVEESLDNAIGLNAMFVALGDRLASYGAAKIAVKDEDWQDMFFRLANASQLIFMMPGPSKGALWELWQIMWSPGLLEKTIFIMPPDDSSPVMAQWALVSDVAAELGVRLPPYSPQGCYFRLREDGQPAEIVALQSFTDALRKFLASPAYTGVIDFADVLKLV